MADGPKYPTVTVWVSPQAENFDLCYSRVLQAIHGVATEAEVQEFRDAASEALQARDVDALTDVARRWVTIR